MIELSQVIRDLSLKALLHALLWGVAAVALIGFVQSVTPLIGSGSWMFPAMPQSLALITVVAGFWCVALKYRCGQLLCTSLLFFYGFSGLFGLFGSHGGTSVMTGIAVWPDKDHYPFWLLILLGMIFLCPVGASMWDSINRLVGMVLVSCGLLVALAHFYLPAHLPWVLFMRDIPVLSGISLVAVGSAIILSVRWNGNWFYRSCPPGIVLSGAAFSFVALLVATIFSTQLSVVYRDPIATPLKNISEITLIIGLVYGVLICQRFIYSKFLVLDKFKSNSELIDCEKRSGTLFKHSPSAMMIVNVKGKILKKNEACFHLLSRIFPDNKYNNMSEILNHKYINSDEIEKLQNIFSEVIDGAFRKVNLRPTTEKHGEYYLELFLLPVKVGGAVDSIYVIIQDLSSSVSSKHRQYLLEHGLDRSLNGVLIFEVLAPDFPIVYVNQVFQELVGSESSNRNKDGISALLGPMPEKSDRSHLVNIVESGRDLSQLRKLKRNDGSEVWVRLSLSPIIDDEKVPVHYVAIVSDGSQQDEKSQQLEYLATHDPLTGLGNRALFNEVLEREFRMSRRTGELLAVLFLDLDKFKLINDTLGHDIGDRLLVSIARRLTAELRPSDTVVRLGGDEFVLMLPRLDSLDSVVLVVERLLDSLVEVHRIDEYKLHISASIGVAVLNEKTSSSEQLLQRADMAMYRAKQSGRNTYYIFTDDLNQQLMRHVQLRNDLQGAIQSESLEINYRPFVTSRGEIYGFEALLCWKHPQLGEIPSEELIALAEESGVIGELGDFVCEQVGKEAKRLIMGNPGARSLAINLSPLQFHRPNFIGELRKALDDRQIPYEWIGLELTENVLMTDQEGTAERIDALQELGFSIAIDNFGTGFSSFTYLRSLPVDKIKIDKVFVQNIGCSESDDAVCRSIINMAKGLGLEIIAQGVETADQLRLLESWGCRIFQGDYFGHPMPMRYWVDDDYRMVIGRN